MSRRRPGAGRLGAHRGARLGAAALGSNASWREATADLRL
jgi:hypothetical protein